MKNIWKALDYRIPVYQGIVGLAMIIIIILVIDNLDKYERVSKTETIDYFSSEELPFKQINIFDNLKIIEKQQIGKSVKDDTILTQLMFSAM